MPNKDYYEALGVKPDASQDDIKRAFRKLAKKYHPDAHPGDKQAEKRFKELSQAHETLGDPKKRKQYDQMREAARFGFDPRGFSGARQGPGGKAGGVSFEDLFGGLGGLGDVFGSFFNKAPGSGPRQERARQGEDALFEVEVSFNEAVSGGERVVTVPLNRNCSTCRGTGARPGTQPQVCLKCGGTGKVTLSQGAFGVSRPCSTCYGRGTIITDPCSGCHGTGARTVQKKVRVNLPAGISDGAKLRMSGQGHSGVGGGPRGDLILTIRVKKHPTFRRDGANIHSEVPINLAQAVLGATIDVPTIDGNAKLRVPPGVSSGAKLRLRGQGAKGKSGQKGDHYVTLKVETPKDLDAEQMKAFDAFAKASGLEH